MLIPMNSSSAWTPTPDSGWSCAPRTSTDCVCRDVHMDLPFAAQLGQPPEPYERLIHDALVGDHSLFTREDSVEETWRILQPLLSDPPATVPYAVGSWGPAARRPTRPRPPFVAIAVAST